MKTIASHARSTVASAIKRLHHWALGGVLASVLLPMSTLAAVGQADSAGMTLADLPPAAQMAIAEAIGRDDAAYHARKTAHGYRMTTAHKLAADFSDSGASVRGWQLSLAALGRGADLHPVIAAKAEQAANRVEYHRGDVTEWYINGPLGLEQGFTLAQAPQPGGDAPLTLALRLPEQMTMQIAANRTDLSFSAGDDAAVAPLRYGKLAAWDASGQRLSVWFETGADRTLLIRVEDQRAHYPIVIDPIVEMQTLSASDGAASDYFGASVALSSDGTTALIGAHANSSFTGAAYVFTRSGSSWSQQQKLTVSDSAVSDYFGYSVALSSDGNTALIGAYRKSSLTGAAYVFTRSGPSWSQQQKLTASDGAAGDYFGYSVALSSDGTTALIGAYVKNSAVGAAYGFTRSGSSWSQQQKLTASDGAANDYFGFSVVLSGDGTTALIGAHASSSFTGAAYVFTRSGSSWSQQQKLTASGGAAWDSFGNSVALSSDGTTALIGASRKSSLTGAAYVFTRSGSSWSQQQTLTASDGATSDYFGNSVALSSDGTTALIGAYGKSSAAGAAYGFTRSGSSWSQQPKLTASDSAASNDFGISLALSGDGTTTLIGADGKNTAAGAAYIFLTMQYCSAGNYAAGATCTPCPSGTYQAAGFNNPSCQQAPAGTYVATSGAGSATACGPGSYQNQPGQTGCSQCPAGTYQSQSGQAVCLDAPVGYFVATPGSAAPPQACAAGTFQASGGASNCITCAAGTVQTATGQSACVAIPKAVSSVIFDPVDAQRMYSGIDNAGVYFSTDGGTNWTAASTQPSNNRVKALVLKQGTSGASATLFAASYGGGVFKSSDGGTTWAVCKDASNVTNSGLGNLNVLSLVMDAAGRLYAGSEAGVFASSDSCANWTAMNTGMP